MSERDELDEIREALEAGNQTPTHIHLGMDLIFCRLRAGQEAVELLRKFVDYMERMYRDPGKDSYWFDEIYNEAKALLHKVESET